MLSAYCPRHEATLLFSTSSIVSMKNTPLGIEIVLRCFCGEHLEVLTGRARITPGIEDQPLAPAA